MPPPFHVGILGMGRIASGLDVLDDRAIRTHLKAVLAEPRLGIRCVSDLNVDRAQSELNRFALGAAVVGPKDILCADLDVLCIASPDGTHLDYLKAVKGNVKIILVEKPLEDTQAARRSVVAALEDRGTRVVLNHQRRWIPGLAGWMDEARAGLFGKALSATIHYSRGFRHNGGHAFDLLAGFLGTDVLWARSLDEGVADRDPADLTQSIVMTMAHADGQVPVMICGIDGRLQTAFSFDIRFERARVAVYDEDGIRADLYRLVDLDIDGFAPELRLVTCFRENQSSLIAEVWRNIADHLDKQTPLLFAGRDVLDAYQLADAIEERLSA